MKYILVSGWTVTFRCLTHDAAFRFPSYVVGAGVLWKVRRQTEHRWYESLCFGCSMPRSGLHAREVLRNLPWTKGVVADLVTSTYHLLFFELQDHRWVYLWNY